MGSGSSRPSSSSTHIGPARKRSPPTKKSRVLVPFLRSFSCGASSRDMIVRGRDSIHMTDFVQGNPTQGTDILASQNNSGKAVTADLYSEACAPVRVPNRAGKNSGCMRCDRSSCGHNSTTFLQNSECLCVSELEKSLDVCSRSENSCRGASKISKIYLEQSHRNCQSDPAEDETNLVMQPSRPSSSGTINESITKEVASSSNTTSHQVVPFNSCPGVPSSALAYCEKHAVTISDNFDRTQSATGHVLDMARDSPNVECGGLSVPSETVSGPSQGDCHLESEELTVIDSLSRTSNASQSENIRVLHNEASDILMQSSGEQPSSSQGNASGREASRNNRRRLWDALMRATSRRRTLSPMFLVASDDIDGLGSRNDSWGLFDWGRIAGEGGFVDGGSAVRRSSELEERRWGIRPQVWALQRLGSGIGRGFGHAGECASGQHPEGGCSCETSATEEETSPRAGFSRIVMLAEALFEVLDEIHRQSVALSRSTSLSLVSSPAPEAVVNSFPLRTHKKMDKTEDVLDEAAQCYICLIEYEDGDSIRTLPCHHEYHVSCVDKWLKEVHRVCPLCRGNVCNTSLGN